MRAEALDRGTLGKGCYTSKQGACIYFSLAVCVCVCDCVRGQRVKQHNKHIPKKKQPPNGIIMAEPSRKLNTDCTGTLLLWYKATFSLFWWCFCSLKWFCCYCFLLALDRQRAGWRRRWSRERKEVVLVCKGLSALYHRRTCAGSRGMSR